jgi:hypothetical protein
VVDVAVLAAVVFAFGLISRRLEGTVLTAPLLFVVAGAILGLVEFGLDDHSVLLHGLTAAPLSATYVRQAQRMGPDAPEKQRAVEVPTRMDSAPTSIQLDG